MVSWKSDLHNMGMAFNRSTWLDILHCADRFCKYDDFNWDWTLQHISQNCLRNELYALMVKGPRVFHIGEWFVFIFSYQTKSLQCCSFPLGNLNGNSVEFNIVVEIPSHRWQMLLKVMKIER